MAQRSERQTSAHQTRDLGERDGNRGRERTLRKGCRAPRPDRALESGRAHCRTRGARDAETRELTSEREPRAVSVDSFWLIGNKRERTKIDIVCSGGLRPSNLRIVSRL